MERLVIHKSWWQDRSQHELSSVESLKWKETLPQIVIQHQPPPLLKYLCEYAIITHRFPLGLISWCRLLGNQALRGKEKKKHVTVYEFCGYTCTSIQMGPSTHAVSVYSTLPEPAAEGKRSLLLSGRSVFVSKSDSFISCRITWSNNIFFMSYLREKPLRKYFGHL